MRLPGGWLSCVSEGVARLLDGEGGSRLLDGKGGSNIGFGLLDVGREEW